MATALTTERVRTAAKLLLQDTQRLQSELNANTVLFKLVAEEMERENDSQAVAELREGLLGVIESVHRLDTLSSGLQTVSESFDTASEPTDFGNLLRKSRHESSVAQPFDPSTHKFCQQFDKAIWNIHHAGEAAPGQEQEEIVMITSETGILNHNCPLSGKPVIDIENPVRSIDCHHIYDLPTVLNYIRGKGRTPCRCAIPGCSKNLIQANLVCDEALKLEIQELRARDRVTQVTQYTEVDDLEDYD